MRWSIGFVVGLLLNGSAGAQVLDHGQMYRSVDLGGRGLILLSLDFSPDGKMLASAGGGTPAGSEGPAQGEVKLWDVAGGNLLRTLPLEGGIVFQAEYSPDGNMLATASGPGSPVQTTPGEIRLWKAASGELIRKLTAHACGAYVVAFSPDGKLLASGGIASFGQVDPSGPRGGHAKGELTLWDLKTGQALWSQGRHSGTVGGLVFSPDGNTLASSGGLTDGQIILWDVATGKEQDTLRIDAELISPVAFGPDNTTLTLVSEHPAAKDEGPFTLQLSEWDTLAKRQLRAVSIKNVFHYRQALANHGELLACAGFDGVKVYDVSRQVQIKHLAAKSRMRPVAFSPDDRLLAAGSEDGTVKLWNTEGLLLGDPNPGRE